MNTEEIQKSLKWVRIVLIVLAIFLGFQAIGALKNLGDNDPVYNTISVNGEGEVVSIPDIATFSFTVSAEADEVSDAQEQVTSSVNKILSGLEDLDIEDNDIKTQNYSVRPRYKFEQVVCVSGSFCPPGRQVQDGFTVSHSLSVKVRETEDAGDALAVVGDGATNVSGISFTVDDIEKLREEARSLAIKDAKEKAKSLAKDLGVSIVRVVDFYDNNSNGPIAYYAEGLGGDAAKTTFAPTIPTGENTIGTVVTVIYEIK